MQVEANLQFIHPQTQLSWYDRKGMAGHADEAETGEPFVIEILHLSRRYGSVQALRDVTLRAEKGSILGLLGQNGAGKTTLLNILTGYLAPTEGRVLVDGHDPLLEPEEARRHLGYLPENPPLYDEMTVREYLHFAAELKGVQRAAIRPHIEEVMELTGLAHMQNRLIGHLSKGYRQRTGMAQALCGDPDVLVLDEPTVGLDPKQITEIRSLIQTLGKGRTIIFSSHILSEVQQLCDHVVILDRGEVRLDTDLSRMKSSEEITLLCTMDAPQSKGISSLRELDGVRSVSVQPSANAQQTTVLITFFKTEEPEKRLFHLLCSHQIPILHLSRSENSLEQVFLGAITGKENH